MKTTRSLASLEWTLSGWIPNLWRLSDPLALEGSALADVPSIPAPVPGSVQMALRQAGLLPDWNSGLAARECEWVENRQWIYCAALPDGWLYPGCRHRLHFQGLDGCGWILVNGREAAAFGNTHIPVCVDITPFLLESSNVVQIVFGLPPRWQGQFGYTSQMTAWKPRFNYTWDWTVRLLQTGVWDKASLEVTDGQEIVSLRCYTDACAASSTGSVTAHASVNAEPGSTVTWTLEGPDGEVQQEEMPAADLSFRHLCWQDLPVRLWYPNLHGEQPLYTLHCVLRDRDGRETGRETRHMGFREVRWEPCEGAPAEATPWICVVNGRPVFLQGVNWTPLLPDFADASEEHCRGMLELYQDLGVNLLRVWGGAVLEREEFYRICDELGIMVWQEFPMSSSGVDNVPPQTREFEAGMAEIAVSHISRRQHHPSLIIWCGGNELADRADRPSTQGAIVLRRLGEICAEMDPTRRFLPTSGSGPRSVASAADYGKGLHWDVHGPWQCEGDLDAWREYWQRDDALLRSETGAPGTSSAAIIRRYAGEYQTMPCAPGNPLWRRTSVWWCEDGKFEKEKGREPESLEEYVEWSQARQAEALSIAVRACKSRFPRCGGVLIWMGHDCFPCLANTSIIDFLGQPKPAALALRSLWHSSPEDLRQEDI